MVKKMQKKRWEKGGKISVRGSFTAEAAFVIPLIILVLIMIFWLIFSWHDRIIMVSAVEKALEKSADCFIYGTQPDTGYLSTESIIHREFDYGFLGMATEDKMNLVLKDIGKTTENRLFLFREKTKKVANDAQKILITVAAEYPGFWQNRENEIVGNWQYASDKKCVAREELTRACNALLTIERGH